MRYSAVAVGFLWVVWTGQGKGPATMTLAAPNATLGAEFTDVSSVRELADGRVLVVDRAERALHVADFNATCATRLGRNGKGPGDYERPTVLLAAGGDSTLVPDPFNGRWLVLKGTDIVGTLGPDAPVVQAATRLPNGSDGHGNVLTTKSIATANLAPGTMPRTDSVVLLRIKRATGTSDSIGLLRMRPTVIQTQGPVNQATAVSVTWNPLTTSEQAVLFADGWIAIARIDPYRVEWVPSSGPRVAGSPLPFERVRLDEREQRAFLQRESERTGRPARDPASLPPFPEVIPPFLGDALVAAPNGQLWIRRAPSSANVDPPYDMVDRQGTLVARLDVGKNVRVLGFGRNAVYTVVTDEDGIQRLQRRPLPARR